jgi:hypothetical protein
MSARDFHVVATRDDLHELEAILRGLHGVPCWRARLRYGDELVLDLGTPRAYRHPLLSDRRKGEWVLGTRASSWDVVGGSRDEPAGVVPEVEGARVTTTKVELPRLELTLGFDNGVALRIGPDPAEQDVAAWELFTASGMYLQAGPGPRWRYLPA